MIMTMVVVSSNHITIISISYFDHHFYHNIISHQHYYYYYHINIKRPKKKNKHTHNGRQQVKESRGLLICRDGHGEAC